MRNADEFGPGRIRYAHGGLPPRGEPARPAERTHPDEAGPSGGDGLGDWGDWGAGGDWDGGGVAGATWPAGHSAGRRHSDLWVLVCGGIAAAAAFAAAFVASGGTVSHPATPAATVPAVVSQACPAP